MKKSNKITICFCVVFSLAMGPFGGLLAKGKNTVRNTKISSKQITNKYGFGTWNLEKSRCTRISRKQTRALKKCVSQRNVRYGKKRYSQYRCKKGNGTELMAYRTRKICRKIHEAMYIESF